MSITRGDRVRITARNHTLDGCEGLVVGIDDNTARVHVAAKVVDKIVPCNVAWLSVMPPEGEVTDDLLRKFEPTSIDATNTAVRPRQLDPLALHQLLLAFTFKVNPTSYELFQNFDAANQKIVIDAYSKPITDLIEVINEMVALP